VFSKVRITDIFRKCTFLVEASFSMVCHLKTILSKDECMYVDVIIIIIHVLIIMITAFVWRHEV